VLYFYDWCGIEVITFVLQELKILEVEVVEGGVECWASLCSLEALRVSSSQV
jgi:hypothetical protein